MNELDFTYEPDKEAQRQAFRAQLPDMAAWVHASNRRYMVRDISAGGLSLDDAGETMHEGAAFTLDILVKGHPVIRGLQAQVTRRRGPVAGARFTDLTQKQEQHLDKLVLEVQKYLIAKRKQDGSQIDQDDKT